MGDFDENEVVTITPMRTFPVIRDLVTDVSYNYEKAASIPGFTPVPREADGTHRMQQVDVERSQEFRKCIECFLCQYTCHVLRGHEDNKKAVAAQRCRNGLRVSGGGGCAVPRPAAGRPGATGHRRARSRSASGARRGRPAPARRG